MKNTTLIYGLYSTKDPSNIRYIGKTINTLRDRLYRHKQQCNINNTYKDRWIRKGLSNGYKIKIIQIDEVDNSCWDFWEIYWIAEYRRQGYKLTNTSPGGDSPWVQSTSKSVIVLNKSGKYIKKFDSIAQSSRELSTSIKDIQKCLSSKSSRRSAKGYQFIYKENYNSRKDYDISVKSYVKKPRESTLNSWKQNGIIGSEKSKKPIKQLTKDGILIKIYASIPDASRELNIRKSGIYKNTSGEKKSYKGFKWEYI